MAKKSPKSKALLDGQSNLLNEAQEVVIPTIISMPVSIEIVQILTSEIEVKYSSQAVHSLLANLDRRSLRHYFSEVGFIVPIVVTPNSVDHQYPYRVVDGNMRLKIANDLGKLTLPCVVVHELSEEREEQLRAGLNVSRHTNLTDFYWWSLTRLN